MKKQIITIVLCIAVVAMLAPNPSFAQIQSGVLDTQVNYAGAETGLDGTTDIRILIATLVQYILGFVATIFLVLMVFASYWLIIARGREDYIEKAKKTMARALVGMTIVLLSYGITTLMKSSIQHVSGEIEMRR